MAKYSEVKSTAPLPSNVDSARVEVAGVEYRYLAFGQVEFRGLPQLTASENDIVRLVLQGQSSESISKQRGRSKHTVNNQLLNIYRKLGVQGRFELIHLVSKVGVGFAVV